MATEALIIQGIRDADAIELAEHWKSKGVQAFIRCLLGLANFKDGELRKAPRECAEDATRDWRYQIGEINATEFAAQIPSLAAKKIEERINR